MIQFLQDEICLLKQKAKEKPSILKNLKDKSANVLNYGVKIPEKGLATWTLYYYCPIHSVELHFNYEDGKHHVCPVCGKVYTGEPYDGAWWRFVNGINADSCYYLALLWMLTGEEKYKEISKNILMKYAEYYPSYEVHGGIPYNNPGKANSQTLCEAVWVGSLVMGYDIIKDTLTEEEIEFIERNLFTNCAEFLMKYRMDQIHNHEVLVGAAIGMLGLVLDRKDIVDFSLYSKYGLVYQLENAVLKDDLWFEGTLHYHYYALEAFLTYEKFARHTDSSLLYRPEYKRMLKMPLKVLQPDYTLPTVSDCVGNKLFGKFPEFYEFAYSVYGEWEFAWILNKVYKNYERDNEDAFLYGVDNLPQTPDYKFDNYHDNDESGFTVLRGPEQRYLLFRHGRYGGEHDHYDKLGISFSAFGENIIPDLGTAGYGALLHYDYFKNTATHNTVAINEENQPPANGTTIRYERENDKILVEAEAIWDGSFSGIDSLTRVEWNEEAYEGIKMRRKILWCENYFVEAFLVKNASERVVDWIIHCRGKLNTRNELVAMTEPLSTKKPLKYLQDIKYFIPKRVAKTTWKFEKCNLNLFSYCNCDSTIYYAEGPDNPSIDTISYMLNRIKGTRDILYVNVFEAYQSDNPYIKDVTIDVRNENQVSIMINHIDGMEEHRFLIGEKSNSVEERFLL